MDCYLIRIRLDLFERNIPTLFSVYYINLEILLLWYYNKFD